jgi:cytoskeletal protein CcmA (bactofilin family)
MLRSSLGFSRPESYFWKALDQLGPALTKGVPYGIVVSAAFDPIARVRRPNVFGRGNKNISIDKIETVIGANTSFSGHIKCDGSVRIDGVCEGGVIETVGNVIVGPNAMVAADIVARNVSVSGAVTGKIKASDRLEILSTGRVWGDVEVGSFLLDEDAYFRGQLVMKEEPEVPPQLARIGAAEGETTE